MSSKGSITHAFGKIIEKHRTAQKLSRAALAEKSGLHQTYIGLLERGFRSPSLETSKAIATALKIPLSDLIRESEKS